MMALCEHVWPLFVLKSGLIALWANIFLKAGMLALWANISLETSTITLWAHIFLWALKNLACVSVFGHYFS